MGSDCQLKVELPSHMRDPGDDGYVRQNLEMVKRVRESMGSISMPAPEYLSGIIGGPLSVGLLTPQRNAMTLAAKDRHSTYFGIYRRVFEGGLLRGFGGGSRPTVAAAWQFTAIGPLYHECNRLMDSVTASIAMSSFIESITTFGAQRRNAQVMFNSSRACASERIALQPMYKLIGP